MQEQVSQIATVFDSEEQHVGQVYAKALLQAAAAQGRVDAVVDELEAVVRDVLDKHSSFELVVLNPKMNLDDKYKLIDRVFAGKVDGILLNLFKVLAKRSRLQFLRAVSNAAVEQRDELAGRVKALVTTSTPLDATAENHLKAKLQNAFGKEIRLVTKVDPSIIGGLIVRIGDTVYDGSVDGQLKSLRRDAGARADAAIRSRASSLAV